MGVSLLEWRMVCLSNDQLTPFVFYTEKITSPGGKCEGRHDGTGLNLEF
jgi:hypothetical protein